MWRRIILFTICGILLCTAFYTLRGETEVPVIVLQTVHLLKKPIEELLPDVQDEETTKAIEQVSLNLDPYQDSHIARERRNDRRHLIESGHPLFTALPSEIAVSTSPIGRL